MQELLGFSSEYVPFHSEECIVVEVWRAGADRLLASRFLAEQGSRQFRGMTEAKVTASMEILDLLYETTEQPEPRIQPRRRGTTREIRRVFSVPIVAASTTSTNSRVTRTHDVYHPSTVSAAQAAGLTPYLRAADEAADHSLRADRDVPLLQLQSPVRLRGAKARADSLGPAAR